MKVLVTGSTGFVGSRVVELARERDWNVTSVVRKQIEPLTNSLVIPSIDGSTDWSGAFEGVDCIVHCAARVHQMNESEQDALTAYRETNTLGTLNLAKQAAEAGVKRFVLVSSIKVNGEFTEPGSPFLPNLDNIPRDPYGLSKYEAEVELAKLSKDTGLEVVIIRPPLVYGPGVKANFLSMMRLIEKGIPLPFGAIHNKRSLVYLDNLSSLILTCCDHPSAPGHTFLASDDHDVSTTQLMRTIALSMGKSPRLAPIPMSWIQLAAAVLNKKHIAQRVCGSLQVEIRTTKEILGWKPPVNFEQGIKRTVEAYLKSH
ncbi:UDP-glucose 4-epimerase family protein [Vibrio crassostreae]|uniref:UDP-glucose 4-epimerase family protein n=1 Tax=Vibrio crassostreae TaxID=246167 RepID=UPI000F4A191F|nr:SDR family oxidoreductase [Vibrio crassostreae]ROP20118.1 nucleoside-diphosphate-sugar epimerase [Vibrio crassostreae]ROP21791.1 nucleoside-diphosphate-sugar epimerase [Vibrio crassostreae]RPE97629.1 nucleoside-diphosphate-sugar epimerase [Vibrio crassostreae]RPE99934.1 nucleoside-diphosphate-sugar epimerase [Vibrio crassostreae]TCN70895.1 nucleoside-diphosphate-sugar epimerase [Vibrio crassostreae]